MPTSIIPSRWLITSSFGSDDPNIFPLLVGQTFVTQKSPIWSTAIAEATSGRERRRKLWSYPRWAFQVQYEFLRDNATDLELQRLYAFFNMYAGRYAEFAYYDPSDNLVTGQAIGVGDGVTTTFQLIRTLGGGALTYIEPVRGVMGYPNVMVDGVTTDVTVGAKGVITFATPPAAGKSIVWSGNFTFICRFDQDQLDAAQMMRGLWSNSGLTFKSVKW